MMKTIFIKTFALAATVFALGALNTPTTAQADHLSFHISNGGFHFGVGHHHPRPHPHHLKRKHWHKGYHRGHRNGWYRVHGRPHAKRVCRDFYNKRYRPRFDDFVFEKITRCRNVYR